MNNIKDITSQELLIKIDPQNVYGSVLALPKQIEDAWEAVMKIPLPPDYNTVNNVVMCGMGGSGLGARVIENLFGAKFSLPLVRVNDYNLPGFVNENTLVICSSYSGETEETIQNVKQAISKKAKWLAIGTGGTLISLAQENNVPYYQINPVYNPSNQPRMAVGYSIISQLAIFSKLGLLKISTEELEDMLSEMNRVVSQNKVENKADLNPAKIMASELINKIPVLISAEHLIGAGHIFNNQLNENSKNMSFDFVIPELNHHLMEGLSHPKINESILHFIFIESDLYSPKIQKRVIVTKDIVGKNNIFYSTYSLTGKNKLSQIFETIQFGAFVNYYLSIFYNQDPAPIPWVDYFKKYLAK